VVYEDQGPPFRLNAGDCVLQPPQIRHRVLESSPGLEVIELTCPAHHDTFADLELELPTSVRRPDRVFGGQRFVHHQAGSASWSAWSLAGFEARDLGIAAATEDLATAHVVRRTSAPGEDLYRHGYELLFMFVLAGTAMLRSDRQALRRLGPGDALVVPPGGHLALAEASEELEFLAVDVRAAS
jgi:quercetin dioxygenase-like cupin family protein